MTRRAPISTLFPYTTLFRTLWLSQGDIKQRRDCGRQIERFPLRVRRDVPSAINVCCTAKEGASFLVQVLLIGAQRLHHSVERLQRRPVEAGADMTGIEPAACARQSEEALVLLGE